MFYVKVINSLSSAHNEQIGNQGISRSPFKFETAGQSKGYHAQFHDLILKGRWRRGLFNIYNWIFYTCIKIQKILLQR